MLWLVLVSSFRYACFLVRLCWSVSGLLRSARVSHLRDHCLVTLSLLSAVMDTVTLEACRIVSLERLAHILSSMWHCRQRH